MLDKIEMYNYIQDKKFHCNKINILKNMEDTEKCFRQKFYDLIGRREKINFLKKKKINFLRLYKDNCHFLKLNYMIFLRNIIHLH